MPQRKPLGARELGGPTRAVVITEGYLARLHIETPFGSPAIPARIDLSPKGAWLDPELLAPVALPIHDRDSFKIAATPVMPVEEVASEKLARYRRTSLTRDLYALAWIAQRVFDEPLVRRLAVLKDFVGFRGERC